MSLETPEDVKALAVELGRRALAEGCRTMIVALSHPTAGWYVAVTGDAGFESLGLAHQVVRSVESIVDRNKMISGASGDV